jgi:pimeloyl-ACP methyl ester carboxylesterase
VSELCYALSGDTHIGYSILVPETELDQTLILAVVTNYPFELMLEQPDIRRFLDGLAAMGRLVLYDRRGIGCSDPIVDWERPLVEQWADDLDAVVEHAGLESVNLVADLGAPAVVWAARRPPSLKRLVLWNYRSGLRPGDDWASDLIGRVFANIEGDDDIGAMMSPISFANPAFRAWSDRAGRTGASPALARRMMQVTLERQSSAAGDAVLVEIGVPTLVIARRSEPFSELVPEEYSARPLEHLPDARFADLSPDWRGDDVSGLSVNIAARVMSVADPGQTLASSTAALAATGQGFTSRSIGTHALKGVDGPWELHELT